jgi:hypothetical protein
MRNVRRKRNRVSFAKEVTIASGGDFNASFDHHQILFGSCCVRFCVLLTSSGKLEFIKLDLVGFIDGVKGT